MLQPDPPEGPPSPHAGTPMSGAAFWRLVDRLRIPDAQALDMIGYPGKLPQSGKRPRFRLTTLQTRLAAYLPEIAAALQATGEGPSWLHRRLRPAPFCGRSPLDMIAEEGAGGLAAVTKQLNRIAMRKAVDGLARPTAPASASSARRSSEPARRPHRHARRAPATLS